MIVRVITSVIALPILIAIVVIGGLPLKLLILLLSILGMFEFNTAILKKFKPIQLIGFIGAVTYLILIDHYFYQNHNYFNIFCSLFILSILVFIVIFHNKYNIIDGAVTLFSFYYICYLMTYIYLVRIQQYGDLFVWLIFISAWGCDTGAYLVGTMLGKNKLTPKLSPNKTVEGAIGGILFAIIIAWIYALIVSNLYEVIGMHFIILCCVSSGVAAIFSQIGDLTASAIKRYTNIKDYGKIIPGHGGILDRFDSILFTAPVVYLVMSLLLGLL